MLTIIHLIQGGPAFIGQIAQGSNLGVLLSGARQVVEPPEGKSFIELAAEGPGTYTKYRPRLDSTRVDMTIPFRQIEMTYQTKAELWPEAVSAP